MNQEDMQKMWVFSVQEDSQRVPIGGKCSAGKALSGMQLGADRLRAGLRLVKSHLRNNQIGKDHRGIQLDLLVHLFLAAKARLYPFDHPTIEAQATGRQENVTVHQIERQTREGAIGLSRGQERTQ